MKRISPATVTFGVMAVALGLVATYVVRQAMRKPVVQAPPPVRPAPPQLRQVVVARVNLPMNTQLSAADMTIVNVPPEHKAVETTIRSVDNAVGRITNKAIRAGQVVRDEYLLGIGESLPDLAERLPPGFRAVSIHVAGASTGGKRLEHGDHVDVALTVKGNHPDLGELQTRTLLRNVLVVDARVEDPNVIRRSRGGVAVGNLNQLTVGDTITVAVNASDANKLITAQQMANLSVTLCSKQDDMFQDEDTTISWKELLALRELPPPPEPPKVEPPKVEPPPPPPRRFRVESFSGSGMRVQEFTEDRIREAEDNTKYVRPHVIIEPTSKEEDDRSTATPKRDPFRQASGN